MKIVRPGNTEFHLIIAQFCEKYCNPNEDELKEIALIKFTYIDWIYKTSGYYDKSMPQKERYRFPEDYTDNLRIYIEKMTEALTNSDELYGIVWIIGSKSILIKYIPKFEEMYNVKCIPGGGNAMVALNQIKNKKKILVISSFKEQIDQQISTGNLFKIRPELENSQFITYKFPYTFLNNGPHQNSLETLEYIQNDIKENYSDFDIAILACGSYGSFLVNFIDKELKKDAIYIGGQLPLIFGIIGKRDKWAIKQIYNNDTTYLIDGIPDECKPTGWEKIESGCYW
jgi:hypothetical protein